MKNCKTNELLLRSENERLGKVAEEAEATRLPEKEKEISSLQKKIENVISIKKLKLFETNYKYLFLKLTEEKQTLLSKYERETSNLKHDLESKTSEINKLESDLSTLNESVQSSNAKLNAIQRENSQLQNQIKVSLTHILQCQAVIAF